MQYEKINRLLLLSFLLFWVVITQRNWRQRQSRYSCQIKRSLLQKQLALDTVDYNKRIVALNNDTTGGWPVKTPYPLPGALLPYQNCLLREFIFKTNGVLGEYPRAEMISKLEPKLLNGKSRFQFNYHSCFTLYCRNRPRCARKRKMYRMRMDFKQIDTVLSWAKPIKHWFS
jgi:hypothetical protein